jgi:hypothetical protein
VPATTSPSLPESHLDLRRRCTGEPHQSLRARQDNGTGDLTIPQAHCPEQEELESAVFFEVCKMGGLSAHPLGIIRVRPEQDHMVIRLLDEPYVIRYWADALLPSRAWDHESADPRDNVFGVYGLRWKPASGGIHLFLPGTSARLVLTGFNPHWWTRIAELLRTSSDVQALHDRPDWSADEGAARRAGRIEDPEIGSPLLRRIRATAGTGPVNSTDAWSSMGGSTRLETTDGPPCPDLIDLFCNPITGLGWEVETRSCSCRCDHQHGGCTVNFLHPETQQFVYYTNLKWRRTLDRKRIATVAELNAKAFNAP